MTTELSTWLARRGPRWAVYAASDNGKPTNRAYLLTRADARTMAFGLHQSGITDVHVVEPLPINPAALIAARIKAETVLRDILHQYRAATLRLLDMGHDETAVKEILNVSRTTVRTWAGK